MRSILLVDDEVRTLDALRKRVPWETCGIDQVYAATCFQEVEQVLQKQRIDLMVCDIEMPNVSGLETLARLRESGVGIPCVFLTCHAEFDYMRRAIQLSSCDYLLKPIDYDDFAAVIGRVVRGLDAAPKKEEPPAEAEEIWKTLERNVVEEVRDYVRDHLMDDIAIADVAAALFFNPHYLMRVFKNRTGTSVMEFIMKERMQKAKRILVETTLPVKAVASLVGYEDPAYFTRVFTREFGVSPKKYRQEPAG